MATSIIPDPSPRWRRLRRWLIRLGVLVILWLTVSLIVAHQLTRRKRARFDEPVPSVLWAKFEEVRLPTSDGQDLGAWYSDGQAQGPSIILLHGNGGHRAHNLSRAEILASTGHSVLLVSLRAHGDSSGDYNDIGYSSRSDVIAAVEFLERKRPGRSIVILGSSLGAAAATFGSKRWAIGSPVMSWKPRTSTSRRP